MIIQALIFLHKLKHVQMSESGEIWLDEDNKRIITVVEAGAKFKTCNFSKKWHEVDPMAQYLKDEGFLDYNRSLGYIHLNIKGYYYTQSVIVDFLLKSVVVPILAAEATTLITLLLHGYLGL